MSESKIIQFNELVSSDQRIYSLTEIEKDEIENLIEDLMQDHRSIESLEAALACEVMATRLPMNLLKILKIIASGECSPGYFKVTGFDVDDLKIGDSPAHWDEPWDDRPYLREEFFQMLISSVIGGVFGWRTQENGRFLRHIIPIEKVKNEQLGGGSATTLLWHTEEAFHAGRADFFTLMCYRNHERATTNIACIDDLELNAKTFAILKEPRFYILPDKSHTPSENNSSNWRLNRNAFNKIKDMLDNPQPTPLIYGRDDMPMMRVDQAFAQAVYGDSEAEEALNKLHEELDRVADYITMQPGDLVLLDNMRVAHGRSIYNPDYGPKQRWMRRVNIANGRRQTFELRDAQNIRVML